MAIPLNDLLMGALTELRVHPSAKWIRASSSGETLVSSTRAVIVWEPRRLVSSYAVPATENRTVCAYRGDAQYWTVPLPGRELRDIAWSYPRPLNDGRAVAGMVAFLTEQLDLTLDGTPVDRPVSPW